MKNILITGCAGFIGSHVVEAFLEKKYTIVGVDCFTYAGNKNNMESFIDRIKFYNLDICDSQALEKIVITHRVDCIINLAAETHVDNSIKSCERFIHSNIDGVRSILDVCRKTNTRLLQVSTDEVYGSCLKGSFSETSRFAPGNPYSATKVAAEHLISAYHNTYGINFKTVRMSNNFGPRQHSEKLIPTILNSIKINKKIPIYGDGTNVRDWFYVKDCAQMVRDVYEFGDDNQVYNLTLCNEKQNLEVVREILKYLGLSFEENVEFVDDRPGHDFRYSIDNSKFLNLVDRKPTDFSKAIEDTIRFYYSELFNEK